MRKHVFLVTWYISENYGTCLQAYAIKNVLNAFADVKFLNRRKYYAIGKFHLLVSKLESVIKGRITQRKKAGFYITPEKIKKIEKINAFANNNYETVSIKSREDLLKIDEWADCYLVGSDQMWSPWMLQPHYLLDFVPTKSSKPRYSYAASFGVDHIPDEKKALYKKYLPQFNKIAVREPRAAELVKLLSGKDATVVLDPTLLLTTEEWRVFSKQSDTIKQYDLDQYLLCYFIGSPEFNHIESAKQISKKLGIKVVLLPTKPTDYQMKEEDVVIVADACAYDFVSLVDHAVLVCTDSFHAVVFSLLMGTAFYDFPRFKKGDKYSQESRLMNIMEKFSLLDSIWSDCFTDDDIMKHLNVDYSAGYEVLEKERNTCIAFLKNMIES